MHQYCLCIIVSSVGCGDFSGKCFQESIAGISRSCLQAFLARQEKSFMLPLDGQGTRLGGNAPNMANVLESLGAKVSCIGTFGEGEIESTFADLGRRCGLYTYGAPSSCLALEFGAAKVFMVDGMHLDALGWQAVKERIGLQTLAALYGQAELIAWLNWGELVRMSEIWQGLMDEVLPNLPEKERIFFIDPSDMGSRSEADVRQMAGLLKRLRAFGQVVISVNRGELQTLSALAGECGADTGAQLRSVIRAGLCSRVVLHGKGGAFGAEREESCTVPTRLCQAPRLVTGGGDSFNAGMALGLLLHLPLRACMMLGNASSACYVREGRPAGRAQLAQEVLMCEPIWG